MRRFRRMALTALLTLALAGQTLDAAAAIAPGDIDILKLPEWEVTASSYGGRLILSDSPEMVTEDGIMYQDTVEGDVRLFFHHVNSTATAKRIVVLLENSDAVPTQVTVYQYGIGGPGYDWMAVGKLAQTAYLAGSDIYKVEVPARGSQLLSTILSDAVVKPNMLVNGIFDFKAERPVTVKVMMLPVNADPHKFAARAKILPADQQHLRGTFAGRDRLLIPFGVYDPARDGAVVITLADNNIDRYLEGIDVTDGSKVVNYGNYGVVYKIFLPSTNAGDVGYYLNPRGGEYAGALGVKYRHSLKDPVATPSGRLSFGGNKLTDFANVGTFGLGESLWLTFSPPGASNLPVKLVVLPDKWSF